MTWMQNIKNTGCKYNPFRTFFTLGTSLYSDIGVFSLIGRYDSFSYAPSIQNPTAVVSGERSQAYILSDAMIMSSVKINYVMSF